MTLSQSAKIRITEQLQIKPVKKPRSFQFIRKINYEQNSWKLKLKEEEPEKIDHGLVFPSNNAVDVPTWVWVWAENREEYCS